MPNYYAHRDLLKQALSMDPSSTGSHEQLDAVLDGVSRLFDEYVGFHFYPSSGVRDITPQQSHFLSFDYPLLNIDTLQTSSDGGSTYGTTLAATDYYLRPYNATEESPKQPWWELETRLNSTAVFPKFPRGVRITGTWGYYNEQQSSTAKLTTALTSAAGVMELTGASDVHPGQTILIDNERIFVLRNGLSGSDTATTSGVVTIQRGLNGSAAAAHTSGTTIKFFTYPIVERAALYQAEMDFRAKDAPLGLAGSEGFGSQPLRAPGGLHPFTMRSLAGFRKPVAV